MAKQTIVTLDGPAGVGKTTLARRTAQAMGLAYLDTGAMYRATAWHLGDFSWVLPQEELRERLEELSFSLEGTGDRSVLSCNGTAVGDEVRTEEVGMWASNLATLGVVRAFQKQAQQAIGKERSLVAEGRDMGTVVFPGASRKFFLDASIEERAIRRYKQLLALGRQVSMDALAQQIARRDDQDRNRAESPLRPAEDAVVIDTTALNAEQVFQEIMRRMEG